MNSEIVNKGQKESFGSLVLLRVDGTDNAKEKLESKSKSNGFLERMRMLRTKIQQKNQSEGIVVNFNNTPGWIDFKDGSWSKFDKYD
jgi:antibiotic biosynthesis monooxygenase (ABM) superfamily enzyme